jgi:hypothetical protein
MKNINEMTDEELTEFHTQTVQKIVQYNNIQMAKKISLNSAYGALS